MKRRRVLVLCLPLCALLMLVSEASGQEPQAAPPEPAASAASAAASPPSAPASGVQAPAEIPSDEVLARSGAVIGEIRIDAVNIFDTRLEDENKALYRLANRLHIQTREETIRRQLLVKPGDPYNPRVLRESERRLRAAGYLAEADIRAVGYSEGRVDLQVTTQDVWTLKPDVSLSREGGTNSGSFSIEESNLLGLGKELGLEYATDVDRTTYELSYQDPQLAGSWWRLEALYADNSDGRVQKFALLRPFHALDARWSAGIALSDDTHTDSIYELGEIVNSYSTRRRRAAVFGGWSSGLIDDRVARWTAGFSFDDRQHAPVANPLPGSTVPEGLRLAYPWVGFSWVEDRFETGTNINQIGKTEDIAMGWDIALLLGYAATAWGSDLDATVFSAKFTKGWQLAPGQRLLLGGAADGRVAREGGLEGSLFALTGRYYLQQSAKRTFYASATVKRSVNPDPDQQILLGGDNGLRGYPLRYQSGEGSWLATLEQRVYTDWYPWRLFRLAGAVFFDMGRTWHEPPGTSQGLLRDIGFGVRLGNTRSATGTVIHMDLAFPLDGDPSISKVQFLIGGRSSF